MEESLADRDILRNWNTLSGAEKGRRNRLAGLACLTQEAEVRGSQEAKGSDGGGRGPLTCPAPPPSSALSH